MMLSVKPRNLIFKWDKNADGDLILYRNGKAIKGSVIPQLMLTYSDISDGEEVRVNVEGIKKHIEKANSCGM